MRPRKWVLVLLCVAAVTIAAATWGMRFFERRLGLETIIAEHVRPLAGGDVNIGSVKFGFLSVFLRDVHATLPLRSLDIEIKDIRIGFSLRRMFATRFDIARSVSSVSLISPVFTVHLTDTAASNRSGPQQTLDSLALPRLPLSQVLISRGTVRLAMDHREQVDIGEALNGRITREQNGISFELHGRLAAIRRNLSITGTFSANNEPHRISIRLDDARVRAPIVIGPCTIRGGRADGVCEILFGPGVSQGFDAHGRVQVRDARAAIRGFDSPFSAVNASVSIEKTSGRIDSLSAVYRGARAHVSGIWDLVGADSSRLNISIDDVNVESVFSSMPSALSSNIYGQGWVRSTVTRDGAGAPLSVRVQGGGVSVLGKPLTVLLMNALVDSGRATIDTLRIQTSAMKLLANGWISVDDSFPQHELNFEGRIDSLPPAPWLGGALNVQGRSEGKKDGTRLEATARARDMRLFGVPFGVQNVSLSLDRSTLSVAVRSGRERASWLRGTIKNAFHAKPVIDATMSLGPRMAGPLLGHLWPRIDSLEAEWRVHLSASGPVDSIHAGATIDVTHEIFKGRTFLALTAQPHVTAWTVEGQNLAAHGLPLPLAARGRIYADSLVIDSAALLGGVRVKGRIGLGRFDDIAVRVDYDSLRLDKLNDWLFDGDLPIDSGTVSGATRVAGFRANAVSTSELHVRDLAVGELKPLAADAVVATSRANITVQPMVVRKGGLLILALDTLVFGSRLRASGEFDSIDIASFLGPIILEDIDLSGRLSGSFTSSDSGLPLMVRARSSRINLAGIAVDSIVLEGTVERQGLVLNRVTAREGARSRLSAQARMPWSFFGSEVADEDTLHGSLLIGGDLLATIGHTMESPVSGSGKGEIAATFIGTSQGWEIDSFSASINAELMSAEPFISGDVTNVSLSMRTDDSSRVHTTLQCLINKRPVKFWSTHDIPRGYRAFEFGPLNFGMLLIQTPKQGVEIHLPGFHPPREIIEVEMKPLPHLPAFALSGPLDRMKISGIWIVRNGQFTYPLFESNELSGDWDPFPYVDWEIDIIPGNRNVMYYRDISGKRRALIRFVEAFADPSSRLQIRGREIDNTMRLLGQLRSYKGSLYFGKVFDRRFEIGLDFAPEPYPRGGGFDNMPIMWGSAEAFSDTSRQDRVRISLQVIDPVSGGISDRGRVAMLPRATMDSRRQGGLSGDGDSVVNLNFHLSSDFEEIAGTTEREFYREAGLRFTTFEGAGEFVSSMGEQYLHRYLLQRFERRLARRLGLDVISLETSIASNYFRKFYDQEFSEITDQWSMLALAHVGVTIGRYFFRDNLFIKARGELVPIEEILVPEYSVGFEFQPVQYLFLDVNYGFHRGEVTIEHDPRINLQLRVPLTRLRKLWDF